MSFAVRRPLRETFDRIRGIETLSEIVSESVVALTVAGHFAFLGYLVIGGFLALRWPRSSWLHIAVVAWGIGSITVQLPCPLTWLERWAREHAHMAPLPPQGFIEHYLTGVVYPANAVGAVQATVFCLVAVSWGLVAAGRVGRLGRVA